MASASRSSSSSRQQSAQQRALQALSNLTNFGLAVASPIAAAAGPVARLGQNVWRQINPAFNPAQTGAVQGLESLARQVAERAQTQQTPQYRPPDPYRLPQRSADPLPPTYANPAIAPNYQDQRYSAPQPRYSEAQLAAALANEFSLMRNASRAAAQDQVFVESNRARQQRLLQGDVLALQRYLGNLQAGVQNSGLNTQERLAQIQAGVQQSAIAANLAGLQMQLAAAGAGGNRNYLSQRFNLDSPATVRSLSASLGSPEIPRRAREEMARQMGGSASDPAALAREQLAAAAARQAAELAARERMQGAELAYRREAPQIQANADDELRRRAALRALQVFNQASSRGTKINLANEGRL